MTRCALDEDHQGSDGYDMLVEVIVEMYGVSRGKKKKKPVER